MRRAAAAGVMSRTAAIGSDGDADLGARARHGGSEAEDDRVHGDAHPHRRAQSERGQQREAADQRAADRAGGVDRVERADARTDFAIAAHGVAREQRQRRAHEGGRHQQDREGAEQVETGAREAAGLGGQLASAEQRDLRGRSRRGSRAARRAPRARRRVRGVRRRAPVAARAAKGDPRSRRRTRVRPCRRRAPSRRRVPRCRRRRRIRGSRRSGRAGRRSRRGRNRRAARTRLRARASPAALTASARATRRPGSRRARRPSCDGRSRSGGRRRGGMPTSADGARPLRGRRDRIECARHAAKRSSLWSAGTVASSSAVASRCGTPALRRDRRHHLGRAAPGALAEQHDRDARVLRQRDGVDHVDAGRRVARNVALRAVVRIGRRAGCQRARSTAIHASSASKARLWCSAASNAPLETESLRVGGLVGNAGHGAVVREIAPHHGVGLEAERDAFEQHAALEARIARHAEIQDLDARRVDAPAFCASAGPSRAG